MPEIILTVNHEAGLHARPLSQFVKVVKSYSDTIVEVTNLTSGKGPSNGASPVKLLLLAVLSGHQIKIHAEGPQAEKVLQALKKLVEYNFSEG